MACEYLILNASDINIQDDHGQTPLFFATQLGTFYYVLLFSLHIFFYIIIIFELIILNLIFISISS